METLFYLGLILVFGSIVGWLSPKIHIPNVVGYLILGLFIGPEFLNLIPLEFVKDSALIIDLSLSIIAVLIGTTIKFTVLKSHKKEVLYITIIQSIATFFIVTAGLFIFGLFLGIDKDMAFSISIILGSIATATAPGTPLAIIHELKAKGEFTSIFLAIVAIDDALALMFFTIALSISYTIISSGVFEFTNLFDSLWIVFFSSILGATAGLLNTYMEKMFVNSKGLETISTIGLIFIVYSLSKTWQLEPLLSAMIMGIVTTNTSKHFDIVEEEIDKHLSKIIFMLFFILSAMHLNIDALFDIPVVIGIYVVLRFVGKVLGAYVGASLAKSRETIKKYMGLALIPQAGVAIGLALSLQSHSGFESFATLILNIVIATTLIQELIGPFMTKYALKKSGDAYKK